MAAGEISKPDFLDTSPLETSSLGCPGRDAVSHRQTQNGSSVYQASEQDVLAMSDAAPARVTLKQRPKSHVIDSRSLPGQEHTGQKHVAQVTSPGEVFAVSVP